MLRRTSRSSRRCVLRRSLHRRASANHPIPISAFLLGHPTWTVATSQIVTLRSTRLIPIALTATAMASAASLVQVLAQHPSLLHRSRQSQTRAPVAIHPTRPSASHPSRPIWTVGRFRIGVSRSFRPIRTASMATTTASAAKDRGAAASRLCKKPHILTDNSEFNSSKPDKATPPDCCATVIVFYGGLDLT